LTKWGSVGIPINDIIMAKLHTLWSSIKAIKPRERKERTVFVRRLSGDTHFPSQQEVIVNNTSLYWYTTGQGVNHVLYQWYYPVKVPN